MRNLLAMRSASQIKVKSFDKAREVAAANVEACNSNKMRSACSTLKPNTPVVTLEQDKHKKKIPKDIINYFNEESLAYWLMTDGKISNNNLFVNMKEFNDKEIENFIKFLENKFNLHQIHLNNYWLEFNSKNIKKIYNITKPYIIPSMKFKFLSTDKK